MPLHPTLDGRSLVVFDAYGTLLDVHAAVARHAAAMGEGAQAFSETWRAKQLEYSWTRSLMGRTEPFWRLTELALDYALAAHTDVDRTLRPSLLAAYRTLDAYPDAAGTLAALQDAGLRTAILSNGDAAMLDDAVASAGLTARLDAVLSVEAAGAFKTDPQVYALAAARFGVPTDAVAFVSSNRWDVAGARAFGFAPVWVNRAGRPDEYADLPPAAVVSTLAALV